MAKDVSCDCNPIELWISSDLMRRETWISRKMIGIPFMTKARLGVKVLFAVIALVKTPKTISNINPRPLIQYIPEYSNPRSVSEKKPLKE